MYIRTRGSVIIAGSICSCREREQNAGQKRHQSLHSYVSLSWFRCETLPRSQRRRLHRIRKVLLCWQPFVSLAMRLALSGATACIYRVRIYAHTRDSAAVPRARPSRVWSTMPLYSSLAGPTSPTRIAAT